MLRAVPSQPTYDAPIPREEAFRRALEEALTLTGPDALARIMQLYTADTRALQAHVDGLAAENSDQAAEKRRYFNMLTQVQMAASHKLWEGAKMGAELATYREITDGVRRAADKANGEPIAWESIAATLAMEPMECYHRPVTLAFLPSEQFRGAQFTSEMRDVTFVFTFIGWALIDHGPGAYGVVEPMFLVEDRAMSRSVIESERHVTLETWLARAGTRGVRDCLAQGYPDSPVRGRRPSSWRGAAATPSFPASALARGRPPPEGPYRPPPGRYGPSLVPRDNSISR
jgi:hypothetical protein